MNQTIDGALRLVKDGRWTKGMFSGDDGQRRTFCLVGALGYAYEAAIDEGNFLDNGSFDSPEILPEMQIVIRAIMDRDPEFARTEKGQINDALFPAEGLGDSEREMVYDSCIEVIATWNDHEERTSDEVAEVLLRAQDFIDAA